MNSKAKKYLRKAAVAERYSCSDRQVDRMTEDGRLPKPMYLRGSKFPLWAEHELDENDRAAAKASRP